MSGKIWMVALALVLIAGWFVAKNLSEISEAGPKVALDITDVTRDSISIDPKNGQSSRIGFTLHEDAAVTVQVFGPNQELVSTLVDGVARKAGRHAIEWEGRDWAGRIVPDEAYFFRITAENEHAFGVYDPLATSGGDPVNPWNLEYRAADNMILYAIPKPCRVLVRAGIDEGPLLKTVVNWEPRVAGEMSEFWTGKDAHNVRKFSIEERADFMVQCVGLPENSIITFGNRETDYRTWYLEHGASRPIKPPVERSELMQGIASEHWKMPVHLDKDPPLTLSFPEIGMNAPSPGEPLEVEAGRVLVRVEVPDADSARFAADQRFELVAFLDDERIAEVELAQLPCNWGWNASEVEPGEHWLTVNLVTFRQHVGIASQRVRIVRPRGIEAEAHGADGK